MRKAGEENILGDEVQKWTITESIGALNAFFLNTRGGNEQKESLIQKWLLRAATEL